jgi:hypothetical protein
MSGVHHRGAASYAWPAVTCVLVEKGGCNSKAQGKQVDKVDLIADQGNGQAMAHNARGQRIRGGAWRYPKPGHSRSRLWWCSLTVFHHSHLKVLHLPL